MMISFAGIGSLHTVSGIIIGRFVIQAVWVGLISKREYHDAGRNGNNRSFIHY